MANGSSKTGVIRRGEPGSIGSRIAAATAASAVSSGASEAFKRKAESAGIDIERTARELGAERVEARARGVPTVVVAAEKEAAMLEMGVIETGITKAQAPPTVFFDKLKPTKTPIGGVTPSGLQQSLFRGEGGFTSLPSVKKEIVISPNVFGPEKVTPFTRDTFFEASIERLERIQRREETEKGKTKIRPGLAGVIDFTRSPTAQSFLVAIPKTVLEVGKLGTPKGFKEAFKGIGKAIVAAFVVASETAPQGKGVLSKVDRAITGVALTLPVLATDIVTSIFERAKRRPGAFTGEISTFVAGSELISASAAARAKEATAIEKVTLGESRITTFPKSKTFDVSTRIEADIFTPSGAVTGEAVSRSKGKIVSPRTTDISTTTTGELGFPEGKFGFRERVEARGEFAAGKLRETGLVKRDILTPKEDIISTLEIAESRTKQKISPILSPAEEDIFSDIFETISGRREVSKIKSTDFSGKPLTFSSEELNLFTGAKESRLGLKPKELKGIEISPIDIQGVEELTFGTTTKPRLKISTSIFRSEGIEEATIEFAKTSAVTFPKPQLSLLRKDIENILAESIKIKPSKRLFERKPVALGKIERISLIKEKGKFELDLTTPPIRREAIVRVKERLPSTPTVQLLKTRVLDKEAIEVAKASTSQKGLDAILKASKDVVESTTKSKVRKETRTGFGTTFTVSSFSPGKTKDISKLSFATKPIVVSPSLLLISPELLILPERRTMPERPTSIVSPRETVNRILGVVPKQKEKLGLGSRDRIITEIKFEPVQEPKQEIKPRLDIVPEIITETRSDIFIPKIPKPPFTGIPTRTGIPPGIPFIPILPGLGGFGGGRASVGRKRKTSFAPSLVALEQRLFGKKGRKAPDVLSGLEIRRILR